MQSQSVWSEVEHGAVASKIQFFVTEYIDLTPLSLFPGHYQMHLLKPGGELSILMLLEALLH